MYNKINKKDGEVSKNEKQPTLRLRPTQRKRKPK